MNGPDNYSPSSFISEKDQFMIKGDNNYNDDDNERAILTLQSAICLQFAL